MVQATPKSRTAIYVQRPRFDAGNLQRFIPVSELVPGFSASDVGVMVVERSEYLAKKRNFLTSAFHCPVLQPGYEFGPIANNLNYVQLAVWSNSFIYACHLTCLLDIRDFLSYFRRVQRRRMLIQHRSNGHGVLFDCVLFSLGNARLVERLIHLLEP